MPLHWSLFHLNAKLFLLWHHSAFSEFFLKGPQKPQVTPKVTLERTELGNPIRTQNFGDFWVYKYMVTYYCKGSELRSQPTPCWLSNIGTSVLLSSYAWYHHSSMRGNNRVIIQSLLSRVAPQRNGLRSNPGGLSKMKTNQGFVFSTSSPPALMMVIVAKQAHSFEARDTFGMWALQFYFLTSNFFNTLVLHYVIHTTGTPKAEVTMISQCLCN